MISNYRKGWGSDMTLKNRTLEGKNQMLGGDGGQKSSKIVGHHLWMIPYGFVSGESCIII